MACFTFTPEWRAFLSEALSSTMEVEPLSGNREFAAFLEELDAACGPIEITVMALDREPMPT